MCALSHSGFGGSRVVISLYALDQNASQFTLGVLMALYAVVPLLMAVHAQKKRPVRGARGKGSGRDADVSARRPLLTRN